MTTSHTVDKLIFNFGFLLEGLPGATSEIDLDYPAVKLDDLILEPLSGTFKASRTAQGIYIEGKLQSVVPCHCARCNDGFTAVIDIHLDDHYYLPEVAPEGELIIRKDAVLNLGALVRENAVMSTPIQPICKSTCQGLCIDCGQNLNEGDCDCESDDIDPRMAKLKELLEQSSGE